MIASVLGPTDIVKMSETVGKPIDFIKDRCNEIGTTLSRYADRLLVVFNYNGTLRLVGDAYRRSGGILEMLYAESDPYFGTRSCYKYLSHADITTKKENWYGILYDLVSRPEIVVCSGLSSGVLTEFGLIKWNIQEGKGNLRAFLCIEDLLRDSRLPIEVEQSMDEVLHYVSSVDLTDFLKVFRNS